MSIFTAMTIATDAPRSRCCRPLVGLLAVLAIAAGLWSAPALASDVATSKSDSKKASVDAGANESTAKPKAAAGCVLCNGIRLQDEIDVVNTRSICSCSPEALQKGLKFESYVVSDGVGYRHWHSSDLESFVAFDPAVTTIFFVHGNQITPSEAKSEGLFVYRKLILQGCDAPRIRFVIYSWPSAKVAGLLRDVREKAARTEPSGYHLAWLLDQMPAETPVSLIGFSLGSRIITGGLHILAGGSLGGSLKLAEHQHPHRAPMNIVLIAAATHSYWLAEGQHHGLAMSQVNRALLINNCADRAMVYYDFIVPGRGGPQALGLCGPTRIRPKDADKIFNRDVSGYVGREHDLTRYICAPGDASLIWDYAGPKAAKDTEIGG